MLVSKLPSTRWLGRATVRLARSDEGLELYRLYLASGKSPLPDVDWSQDPSPYWLVAEQGEQMVGCVQLRPSKPIGMIELLCIDPTLTAYQRARVFKHLVEAALVAMKHMGAQAVTFGIDQRYPSFVQIARHYGAWEWYHEPTYLMRF